VKIAEFTEVLYCLNLFVNARRIAIEPRFNIVHPCLFLMLYEHMSKLKIVESIIARLKSGKQTRSRLHSPEYYRYWRHVLLCKKYIFSYVRASCVCWTYLRFFSWRSLLLAIFQHWGNDYNDISAALQQSTEVAK
jgi:hypothetical protein